LYPCFLYSAVVPIFIHCCCVTSSWWPMSLHFFLVDPKKSNLRLGPRPQQLWFAAFHALRPRDLRGGSPWRQWVIWRQGPCRGESEMSLFEIKCIYIYIHYCIYVVPLLFPFQLKIIWYQKSYVHFLSNQCCHIIYCKLIACIICFT
jgi:hypothetical protein